MKWELSYVEKKKNLVLFLEFRLLNNYIKNGLISIIFNIYIYACRLLPINSQTEREREREIERDIWDIPFFL